MSIFRAFADETGEQLLDFEGHLAGVYSKLKGTAARLALITFLLIVGLPLAILLGMAVAAAALVFGGLSLLGAARRRLGSVLPGHDGRSNVRVIQRDDR